MSISRRKFLQIGGACAAGLGAVAVSKTAIADGPSQYVPMDSKAKATNWAMVIDMSRVEDIQACVDACHKFHNVPNIDTKKDEVKWLWTDSFKHLFLDENHENLAEAHKERQFFALCNQCENPACVRVCPTKATFKNDQGIVMMDMHRCIGCRYCMAGCPYGARSFNFKDPRPYIEEINPEYPTRMKGVVEKCTFCVERLAEGKLPLCVEASNGAIVFGDQDDPNSEISKLLAQQYTLQRKADLGTKPKVYYIM